MPIFGRKKREAEAKQEALKDSAVAGRPKYSMPGWNSGNGSGETKGNQPQPPQKREQQTPITPLETKKVTSIKGPTQKPQELKGSRPSAEELKPTKQSKLGRKERKELERVAKAAAAVQRRKDAMAKKEAASKAVKDEEAGARIYGIGKQVGTKKKVKDTSTSTDTRTPEQVDKGNARANFNRSNKSKAKPGETYKYKRASGEIVTITKGNKNKKGDKIPSPK